jgi:hypothetical protein
MQLLLLACGGEGEGLKVGHWPNGGSFPLDWLSYTPIHSARNAQVELQLSSRLHVFFFSYCDPFLLSCVRFHPPVHPQSDIIQDTTCSKLD